MLTLFASTISACGIGDDDTVPTIPTGLWTEVVKNSNPRQSCFGDDGRLAIGRVIKLPEQVLMWTREGELLDRQPEPAHVGTWSITNETLLIQVNDTASVDMVGRFELVENSSACAYAR